MDTMASPEELAGAFATAAGIDAATLDPEVGAALVRACDAARARWPGIELEPTEFAARLGAATASGPPAGPAEIAALHTDDLWLAGACTTGDRAAIAAFDRAYIASVPAMVARVGLSHELLAELEQRLRERLLLTTPTRPAALARYAGRGSLAGWLKVVAMREALVLAERSPWSIDDGVDGLVAPGHDPEFDHMRAHYGEAFRTAFATALAGLVPRDRALLRGHLVERLSIDQLAALHQVHRSTAARWLVAIREQLATNTRDVLVAHLSITPAEYDSILRLVRSQLDITLAPRTRDSPG